MRFVFAIVSFVIAASLIGLGIAQKTVFAEPDEMTAATSITSSAPVTVVTGKALTAFAGSQFVHIGGSGKNFSAYGRTTDVLAWIGDASYNSVAYSPSKQKLVSTLKKGTDATVPSPVASDLWLASYTDKTAFTVNVPDDISLLIVTDGTKPAPSSVSVTWPLDNSTPWANTFVVAGGVFVLIGLLLLFWAVIHIRRSRGPRRKSQKMPKLPRQPRFKAIKSKPKAIEANARGRRSIQSSIAVVPIVLVTALALGGCSSDFWAGREAAPTASPTADPLAKAEDAVQLKAPAVTEKQAQRIIANIAEVAATADASMDPTLIATRLTGPALEARVANYTARKADAAIAPPEAIPSGPVQITLPQQSETWPRVVFAVINDSAKNAEGAALSQVAVMLQQDDARSNYKVQYVMRLEPGAVIPALAPTSVGAGRLKLDSKFLTVTPGVLAADYSDILLTDTASPADALFEATGDTVRTQFGLAYKTTRQTALPATSTLTYATAPATGPVIALSTNDSGAIVTVNLKESETVKVVEAGAVANASGTVKALIGKDTSTKGFTAIYGYQLLFYVPSAIAGGKVVMLGFTTGIVSASELP